MPVQSLGYRTDLFFIRELGEIEERDRYLVARTPSNPTFFWGNFLLYPEAPTETSLPQWTSDFAREFPNASHVAFGWDSARRGHVQAFLAESFGLCEMAVLHAARVHSPARINDDCVVRALESESDWKAACDLAVRNRGAEYPDEQAYQAFKTARLRNLRKLQQRGLGFCYGAFEDEALAGMLGIFGDSGIARFQEVTVDESVRRRGICGSMVWRAAQHMASRRAVQQFVIVADVDNAYNALAVYKSVGFTSAQAKWGLCKRP